MFGVQYSQDGGGQPYLTREEGAFGGAITDASIQYGYDGGVTEMKSGVNGIENGQNVNRRRAGEFEFTPVSWTAVTVGADDARFAGEILTLTNYNSATRSVLKLKSHKKQIAEVGDDGRDRTVELGYISTTPYASTEEILRTWGDVKVNVTRNIAEFTHSFETEYWGNSTKRSNVTAEFTATGTSVEPLKIVRYDLGEYVEVSVNDETLSTVHDSLDVSSMSADSLDTNSKYTDSYTMSFDDVTSSADDATSSGNDVTASGAHCGLTDAILSNEFALLYQKVYTALFLACLIVVVVLYVLIYQSVLARRTKRQRQKNATLSLVTSQTELVTSRPPKSTAAAYARRSVDNCDDKEGMVVVDEEALSSYPAVLLTTAIVTMEPDVSRISYASGRVLVAAAPAAPRACRRNSSVTRDRIANIKTAAMLFVVTVVFIVTYLPAFLMALEFIPNNIVIFYIYFANNAANPVIYSFMNQNFRNDVTKLFCKQATPMAGARSMTR